MIQKIFIVLFTCLFSFSSFSSEKWKEYLQKRMPPSLQTIQVHKSTQAEIQKILGKPSLVEKNKYYYEMNQFKYALELVFVEKKLSELSYTFIEAKPSIAPLKLDIKDLSPFPGKGKSPGRFLKYSDAEGDIIIDPTDKTVYSVRFK